MAMMIDAFQPEGITQLAVDSIFMMPHLGVLSEVHPLAATEVFEKDCLIHLGPCVAPKGNAKYGAKILEYRLTIAGETLADTLNSGQMRLHTLEPGQSAELELNPARGMDVGNGPGRSLKTTITGGVVGLVLDGRGRPLTLPENQAERERKVTEWNNALKVYPVE